MIGMDKPFYYRNKIHRTYGRDRKGNVICGTYQEGTHRIVSVDECLIEDKMAQAITITIRDLLKSFKIKTYDEDTRYGLLRHVLVRCGVKTGEYMVVLVLASPILPSKNNFVKALRKVHPEITTVVLNVNDKKTSMILGEKETVLYGKGFIRDVLCGCSFRISPRSFYQINPTQTEILYQTAIDFAGLTGKEDVIDAYCGIGTIGMIAAKKAGKVLGIELNKDAGTVSAVAVDNFRLAIRKVPFCQVNGNFNKVVIPSRALNEMLKILPDSEEDTLEIYSSKNFVSFRFGNVKLVSRLLEGEFLDYKAALPKEYKFRVNINVRELTHIIERAALMANSTIISPIRCSFDFDRIEISTASNIGKFSDTMMTETFSEDMVIGFNYKYMLAALSACDDEEAVIELQSNLAPIIIRPKEKDDYLFLVLPLRMKEI
jgi:tRNA G37 N-methylase Trm5